MRLLEFLKGAERDLEHWKCGICDDSPLEFVHLGRNSYKFTCGECKNSLSAEIIFLEHDYYHYPEDFSEPEVTPKGKKRKYTARKGTKEKV